MRILLTNDDGIYAPGLRALRQELMKLGEVTVVAPAAEQSAAGHSVENAALIRKAQDVQGRSLWVDAWRRLKRNRAAIISMALLAIIALMAVLAPLLSRYSYETVDYSTISCAPDWWPGTDAACRETARADNPSA